MTENDLIKQCKGGNREAFNELFTIYQQQVINVAYSMLSDREDAFDATQEVFVRVYKNIESFKEQSSFATWLYRITSNVCSDMLRKRQRSAKTVSINQVSEEGREADIPDTALTPEENAFMTERQRAVREAINSLKEEYRVIITLCDIEDMSYDRIAEMLKLPKGTVKSRINRARGALKKKLMEKRELF